MGAGAEAADDPSDERERKVLIIVFRWLLCSLREYCCWFYLSDSFHIFFSLFFFFHIFSVLFLLFMTRGWYHRKVTSIVDEVFALHFCLFKTKNIYRFSLRVFFISRERLTYVYVKKETKNFYFFLCAQNCHRGRLWEMEIG